MTCRHIDLALDQLTPNDQESLSERITAELSSTSVDPTVAYRGLLRYVLQYRAMRIPKPTGEPPRLRQGGTYLITGGLGGIGMILAEYLARSYKAKLLLISRTGLAGQLEGANKRSARSSSKNPVRGSSQWPGLRTPEPSDAKDHEIKQRFHKLENLQRLGAEVMVVCADVTDLEAMRLAVDGAVSRFGPIRGVIHSAGVPGGGVIQRRTRESAEAVLAPKVMGTLVLDQIFQQRDLDFFILCSSLNSVVGGFGQADYSAANAFLDAFAHHRSLHSRGLTASINWDAWREVGMAVDAARARGQIDPQAPAHQSASASQYRELAHPLFDRFMVDEHGAEIYATRLAGNKRWVLTEHRVAGKPTLPGTAYLELARAAFEAHLATVAAVELRDVSFRSPLIAAEDAEPEVRTILRPTGKGDECEFTIESRPSPERGWQTHASGRIATIPTPTMVRHDIERLVHDTPQQLNLAEQTMTTKQRPMEFGPRWNNLLQARFGRGRGLALIQHPRTLESDLDVFMLHPAILDSATGFVATRSPVHYLPFAYRKIRVLRPLLSCVYSYAAYEQTSEGGRELMHIHLTIMDTDGCVLVEVEDYVLVKVSP